MAGEGRRSGMLPANAADPGACEGGRVSDHSGSRQSSAVSRLLCLVLVAAAFAPLRARPVWGDYQAVEFTAGNPGLRLDFLEAHLGVGATRMFVPGIGIGTSLFRAMGATWGTGLASVGGLPLDAKIVWPILPANDDYAALSLRFFGTCCFWAITMYRNEFKPGGRWYGGGAGLDLAPQIHHVSWLNFGLEVGWQRVVNPLREIDRAGVYWGFRVGLGHPLYGPSAD
jgi:hypothetical protein